MPTCQRGCTRREVEKNRPVPSPDRGKAALSSGVDVAHSCVHHGPLPPQDARLILMSQLALFHLGIRNKCE